MALDLTFDAGTLSRLRKAVFDEAAGAGMPNRLAADVVIAVHELAANAVRHGAGAGLLTMRIQAGRLRCRVSDTGPERIDGNAFRTTTTGQPWPVLSGHGLWLVGETADEVTVASGPDGYSVTALFRLSG